MSYVAISPTAFSELDGLDDWRFVLGGIRAEFTTDGYPSAASLITAISEAAELADHHPDIDLRYPGNLQVTLQTHATGGLTTRDVDLARTVSALAADTDASSSPARTQVFELGIDTMDADRIRPFWAAILGYEDERGYLVDPMRQGPPVWFQQMDEPRPEQNRFHLDVSVPHDVADERVAAALAAGGRLVSDARARAFWVLADADGNKACVCTWQDRD